MSNTKLQSLMIAIADRLKTIRTANDYRSEIGSNVFWHYPNPVEYGKNLVNVSDSNRDMQRKNLAHAHDLTVEIEIYIFATSAQIATDPYYLGIASSNADADVIEAIGVDDTFGNLSTLTNLISSENAVELEGKNCIKRCLTLEVNYMTTLWGNSET